MSRQRTWSLRLNLDEFNALVSSLFIEVDKAYALMGLSLGCNGGALPESVPDAFRRAWELGRSWRDEAENFQEKQREGGRASAANRAAKYGSSQPVRSDLEVTSTSVRSDLEVVSNLTTNHKPQTNNQQTRNEELQPCLPEGRPDSPARQGKSRKTKAEDLGNYPDEMKQAVSQWRALLSWMKTDEIADQFKEDKRFVAAGSGGFEAVWKAWEKRMQARVQGVPVTHQDMLAAVRLWIEAKRRKAEQGIQLSCPMLPTLINSPDFVDALVFAVRDRQKEHETENTLDTHDAPAIVRTERLAPFRPEVVAMVLRLESRWPRERGGALIRNDAVDTCSAIEAALKEQPDLDLQTLEEAAVDWLQDPGDYPNAMQFWFGPGKAGAEAHWKRAVRGILTRRSMSQKPPIPLIAEAS